MCNTVTGYNPQSKRCVAGPDWGPLGAQADTDTDQRTPIRHPNRAARCVSISGMPNSFRQSTSCTKSRRGHRCPRFKEYREAKWILKPRRW